MHSFSIYLFQRLYMFRAASAHHQEGQLVIPDSVLIQVGPPNDEHLLFETYRCVEKNTLKNSASRWSLNGNIKFLLYNLELIFSFLFRFQVSGRSVQHLSGWNYSVFTSCKHGMCSLLSLTQEKKFDLHSVGTVP